MTRIALAYPKIAGSSAAPLAQCIAFEKYDGTNIHWAWNREIGWYAFGMRRNRYDLDPEGIQEFHRNHPEFPDVVDLFRQSLEIKLTSIFNTHPAYSGENIVVFTEYFGEQSFAGQHEPGDPKQLILIDIETDSGIIFPQQFIADFADLNIARVVYQGKLTGKFIDDVRKGEYNVFEGVVCKGVTRPDILWMAKIKTDAYLKRLKASFADRWTDYWE